MDAHVKDAADIADSCCAHTMGTKVSARTLPPMQRVIPNAFQLLALSPCVLPLRHGQSSIELPEITKSMPHSHLDS